MRRSVRQFGIKPVPLADLSGLLACLRSIDLEDGTPKYRYGSAGGLYPVQPYVYVKRGRIEDLGAGIYYYHPVEHRLISLTPGVEIPPTVFDRLINRPMFEEAAFGVFLIGDMEAIEPMYGHHALRFATLEAGLMSQLLEEVAPNVGLGLCQIGYLEFDPIRHFFALRESHVLLNTLLGGGLDESEGIEDPAERVLRQVQGLSPEEVQALLDADPA
jgi:SagB-type dehydrogenase family enzyme